MTAANYAAVNKQTGIVEFFAHETCRNDYGWWRIEDEYPHCDHLRFVPLSEDCFEEMTMQLINVRLVTSHLKPPIPPRDCDWGVMIEGQEEYGYRAYGKTEGEALSDFIVNYEP